MCSLSAKLKGRTKKYHINAEKTAFIQNLLKGRKTQLDYCLYLHQLLFVYEALERKIQFFENDPEIKLFAIEELFRQKHIKNDLDYLSFESNIILQPCNRYLYILNSITKEKKHKLIGHAYVRYLGDLSGGQVIRKILQDKYQLPRSALTFYSFNSVKSIISDPVQYLKTKIDGLSLTPIHEQEIIASAIEAFQLNISLFESLEDETVNI